MVDNLTQGVLFASDLLLIPVDYDRRSLNHGITLYNKTVPKIQEFRLKQSPVHVGPWNLGLVYSNCPADVGVNIDKFIDQYFQDFNFTGKVCKVRLRTYTQTKVAEFRKVPAVCWRASPITKLFDSLVDEIFLKHNFVDH
ncbi:hypothetical protein DO97_18640 [Neosynechococcus sphagnicola sy1]|uniref:Uncharacterized protein n=1 Tax=Neosynechococcus sphagnicola sy1 TaxID=1497020 RepID=A0A098TMH5_9CYAN|nr:hypothetical protein DO97_18640 [Neosynechococcus sphagnicola sy1]